MSLNWRRRTGLVIAGAVLGFASACVVSFVRSLPDYRVVHQWTQPPSVDYRSFGPYTLSVIEVREGTLLGSDLSHVLYVGRGKSAPDYGHWLDYSVHPAYENEDLYISRCEVKWTPEGLTFSEPDGHRVFVPKDSFIGGR